ncbi:multidrug effflux MFS transporter [Cognatishimia sp.]|uniref:multidrug effflux MFS transporter n=1 Tax=Cognatishimia sp. TaxID=2211648 RepID=UPI00351113FD|nr:multidrug effflux MFS transporter [Cognatishimia sp.]
MYLSRKSPPHISTLILLAGLSAMVMNVFLPSLPGMTIYFDTDYSVMQLAVAGYLGASAVLQVLIGPISDQIGRRPVLLWGIFLFLVSTLGCIYAPNATIFLIFRIAQAVIATCLVLSRAIVRDVVEDSAAASKIGFVTMGMSVVPMVAPALGGLLEETWDWRACFWLMFGSGSLALALVYFDLGETKRRSGLTLGAQFKQYPELLMSPRFWGYSLASGFASGAFFAYLGGAPFVASGYFALDPTEVGIYFGAPAIGYFLGNYVSGAYSQRIGVNNMVLWGSVVNAIGVGLSLLLFAAGTGSAFSFFAFMTFVGLGNGMVIPNATAGALSVRPHLAGTASGLASAIMIGGGAGLSALAGVLLEIWPTPYPLLLLMLATALAALVAIMLTIRRERRLQG